ncbi:MAG TPA: CRTAC1 family protein [Candidatus Polarisedimenticolia bacterium]|jgi:hypothetical protein
MLRIIAALAAAAALVAAPASTGPAIFTDVTRDAGLAGVRFVSGSPDKDYILETTGTGAAAFDIDNDGWLDIYLPNGSRLDGYPRGQEPRPRLFRNKGKGLFEDVTAKAGLADPFWGFGVAVGDYDNDGFSDLYVTSWGPNKLFHNRGDGTFEEVGSGAGVGDPRWGASAAFADFDNDGQLDLYVANYVAFDPGKVPRRGDARHPCVYRGNLVMCGPTGLKGDVDILYHNNGDGTFTDVSAAAGIRTDIGLYGLGVAAADYDGDGDVDIFVANDATPNQLYRNRGDGTFDEVGALSGVAYGVDGAEMGSMGTSFGDYDGDGSLDLMITNFSHQFYQLLRYAGEGYFEEVTAAVGLSEKTYLPLGWATDFFDYDNDGWLDLFFANGHVYPGVDAMQIGATYLESNQLFHNEAGPGGARRFEDASDRAGASFVTKKSYRAGGPLDFDRDGDADLLLTVIDSEPVLLRNDAGSSGRSATFHLVGTASNRSAIGARLTVTAAGRTMMRYAQGGGSYLWSRDPWIQVGLGSAEKIDTLEVRWPSGRTQRFRDLAAGRTYDLVEGQEIIK